jgi:hypothetical protein
MKKSKINKKKSEENQLSKKYVTSLALWKIQNKTLSHPSQNDYHQENKQKCWRGCGGKGTLIHCWWECKLVQTLWKSVWRVLRKLKLKLSYNPAIPLLSIHPKECKSAYIVYYSSVNNS